MISLNQNFVDIIFSESFQKLTTFVTLESSFDDIKPILPYVKFFTRAHSELVEEYSALDPSILLRVKLRRTQQVQDERER
jgi:hypothetical protein